MMVSNNSTLINLTLAWPIVVSALVRIQRLSPLINIDNNTYDIICTINIQPNINGTDINGTNVTVILTNNVYVSSRTVATVLGDDLTATCNWNTNRGIFTNTTTLHGILLQPYSL